jgi:hypothetical protein
MRAVGVAGNGGFRWYNAAPQRELDGRASNYEIRRNTLPGRVQEAGRARRG